MRDVKVILALEREKERRPEDYPMRSPAQRREDYWSYWTPERIAQWRASR